MQRLTRAAAFPLALAAVDLLLVALGVYGSALTSPHLTSPHPAATTAR